MSSSITVDPGCAAPSQPIRSKAKTAATSKTAIKVFVWSLPAVAYFALVLTQPPAIHDEGLIAGGAERILRGQLPYRDFDTCYPPAEFYTIAAVFRVFGATLLAARVWDSLWRLAILAAAVVLAGAAARTHRAHPLPLICGGILTGAIGFHMYPAISGTLPCMAALWCAVRYLQTRSRRWLFASGLLAGAGILYRHDLALCICAAIVATACYQAIMDRNRRWLEMPAVFGAGVLLVVAPTVPLLWWSVPRAALVHSFIDFPKASLAARQLPLPGPWSLVAWSDLYLPLAVILVAVGILKRAFAAQRPIIILLLITSTATLFLATQRLDTVHAYPAIMFALVLLSVCVADLRKETMLPALLKGAAIVCYGLLPLTALSWTPTAAGVARAGPIQIAADQVAAIEYIQRHLPPGEPLYVGLTRHSLQFFNDAIFYFLADRPQATRFDMFVPGFTSTAAVQSEIARDLSRKRVEYVVLFRAPLSREPNLSSVDNGITILDDAIRQDYRQVAQFGSYTICRRTVI